MDLETFQNRVFPVKNKLYRFSYRLLGSSDEAKDVVQESFARLWQKVGEVDPSKAKSYLFTTAHHIIVDTARRGQRSLRMEEQHEDLSFTNEGSPPDLKRIIDAALATLPDIQRSVILLRDLEGYSYDEIAELTGLNLTQVKVYIYRGRTALKEYIGKLEVVL